MLDDEKKRLVDRLRRIEGQAVGVRRMIEGDRRCLEILNQLAAVVAAMRTVEDLLLRNHLNKLLLSGSRIVDGDTQQQKIVEFMRLLSKIRKP